ncbi:eCIS core domain-containing protein [Streptomyces mordarskii]|uniref:eCIS core domain-containing protein n=1 Tax=Streptomyces mordarskii TaxID=1226758 RepID=UPI003EDB4A13
MSNTPAATQDDRASQSAKRRKRKERTGKARAPEPKDIVSGAGQPLDPSVRRDLEEQLGHDLGQVRLHTDRDAGHLTELLGADAVAVGQDIFFRENTYRPGTTDGQRLLAHELLHTVQNPHGLGALRAGRDLGAVSLPQDAMEREAEGAARELVRGGRPDTETEPQTSATPGWLRYATVDADRNRMEKLDPATLVDRLANGVIRSLRGDPEDRSQRTRMQLERMPDEVRDAVLDRLETRLLSSEHERVLDFVDEIEADGGLERESLAAPDVEPDSVEELLFERETGRRRAEERREEEQRPAPAPGPEKDQHAEEGAPGSTPQNGGGAPEQEGHGGSQEQRPGADAGREGGSASSGGKSGGAASAAPAAAPPSQQPSSSSPSGGKPGGGQRGGEKTAEGSEKGKQGKEREGKEGQEQQGVATASKEESAAKNRPGAADALVAGQQLKQQDKRGTDKPTGSPTVSGKDTQSPGAFSTLDGVRAQDLDGPEEQAEEDPFGSGSESEVEVGGEEKSAWDTKLQPEDFLPEQDLDVSGVPTADTLDPASSATPPVPSFPAPPVTKADKVQAERDAEDAEDEAADAEPDEDTVDAGAEAEPSVEADDGAAAVGGGLGDLAVEQAAESRPGPAVTRDPKSGADPKDGPVVAQTTVQEAAGRSEDGSEATEQAAKEEKGTPAAGAAPGGAQEKASQQAVGGQAAQEPAARAEQKKTDAEPAAAKSEPTADADSPSPARDTQVTGGSNADTPGGASSGAQSEQSAPAERTEAPAAESAPSAPEPTKTAGPEQTAQPTPAPAPSKGTPAPKAASGAKAAAPKSAPSARTPRGGGGSGGGGGRASAPAKGKKKDSGPAPNLSQVSPEAGLSTASKLKPHVALQAMTGVSGSVDRTVGDEHKALAAAPPSMQRPAGAPQTLQGKPATDAAAQYSQDPAQKSEAPEQEDAEVTGAKEPEGQIEAEKAEEPGGWDTFKMALGFIGGKIVNGVASLFGADEPVVDPQELAAKFAGLPTKDEALKQAQAGNAPGVQMRGDADQTAGEQGSAVDTKGQETVATGRDDAGRGMGEDQVYPDAPKEQMAAKVPGQGGGGGGGAPGGGATTGAVPPEAASEVAEHERGPQFQAAFTDGQKGMSEGRQTKDRDFRDGQQKHKQQVDAEVAGNTKSQANEREKAMTEVTAKRADWRTEQDKELQSLGDKKTERHEKIRKDVKDKEEQTDKDVDKEKEDSDKKIQDKGDQAERDAEKKRDDSVQESGNWISKAFEWIKNKVIEIKKAIVRVIREARDAVVNFIKNFKETVERWINDARKAIVDAIKNFINDLIEFAKAMVRAVIDLAKRVRDFITGLINAAIALVNKLATMLKQAITDLLNALGKLLSSILDVLKKMLQDVVKAVVDAVKAVLDFASKLLGALGDFMLIAVDFLSDPGGWLSGAKNSAVDGAKNHLFREVKSAVKEWFQSKIQEIIGVPKAILDKLFKGGFTLEQIVKETWDAIVPQLPFIIGEIVITKVIAKLIPGAGWVMAVIDAIRTAIGALGAILRAMGAVLDWLKLVRMGGAGLLFAKAVAAGIVALLELAYQALLSGIGKYVAKVGRRFKAIAAKLGQGKGGKGGTGGKGGADGEGADGRGGKPKPDEKPQEPTAPKTTARPTPTTTKPKPGAEPTPKKPTTQPQTKPTKADTPGRPKPGPADTKRPTGANDKNGRPKTEEDERPDTRLTPTPKPKPEPPAKPKPEPQTKPNPKDGKTPGTPKDDKGPENRPKNDDKPSTKDPKDQDPTKPKPDKDGDKPTRPKEGDGKKPKPDKDGDRPGPRKPKPDKDGPGRRPNKKGPNKRKPHPDKSGPGRPKSKPEKDRRKKEEDSRESKEDRLDEIIARIRPRINEKLLPGIVEKDFQEMLDRLQSWYRLTGLEKRGGKSFSVIASLNPDRISNTGHEEEEYIVAHDQNSYKTYVNYLEEQKDPDLPSPVAPDFNDDQLASNFEAKYLNRLWAKKHGEWISQDAHLQIPKPFQYILQNDLNQRHPKGRWVRMHMLPAALGGPAKGSNLVPARSTVNNPEFYQKIEKFAEARIAEEDDTRDDKLTMISYKINLTYHKAEIEGFPRTIEAEWKTYDYDRSKKDWDEVTPVAPHKHDSGILEPPPTREGNAPEVYLNSYDAMKLRKLLGISKEFASAITKVRNNGTKPQSVAEVIERIENDPEITLAGEAFNEGKAVLVQEQNRINWGTHRRR